MADWNDGYFTESTYVYGYYRELNPVFQRFCLLANGYKTSDTTNHCELGFGQGVSISIHAAANAGKYFGTDFNPTHAANANELCNASNCGAKFFDDSFEEMLHRDDLPQFDSISLHGIWSWISTENQKHIVEFARKFLKPGGIFYNSYNCLPGWAPALPMRELFILHDKYSSKGTSTYERVEAAMKFTEELFNKNPAYFNRVPDVKTIFESTRKNDHNYLAHEYFNRDWICMYFSEVAEMLQGAKLDFACAADPIETLEHLMLTANAQEFLNKIEQAIMREQVKDYFINRQFRKDIYIRGARKISIYERSQLLLDTKFILLSTEPLPLKVPVLIGEVNLSQNICEKIYNYLKADNYSPKNFREFIKENPDINLLDVEQFLIIFANRGEIAPCQNEEIVNQVKPKCAALNDYLCGRAKISTEINYLASPVTGGGVYVNRFEQIFISIIASGKTSAEDIAEETWNIFLAQGQQLMQSGEILNLEGYTSMVKHFLDKRLPIFKALQII